VLGLFFTYLQSDMAVFLSAQHAINTIRLHWLEAGFDIGDEVLGKDVAAEFGQDVRTHRLGSLYAFLDEYLVLLRYVSYYFLFAVPASGQRAMLYNRLAIRQLRTAASIRALCSLGLDGNARLQLRLLYETSLLWVRVRLDPNVRQDFESSGTPEQANAFWHKYLSKEKNEKWLTGELAGGKYFWLGAFDTAIAEMKSKISVATHPTWLQAYLDTLEDWELTDGLILSQPSEASHFTLSFTLLVAAIPFSLKPDPPYALGSIDIWKDGQLHPKHRTAVDWEEYNRHLRDMFVRLYLASMRFTEELSKAADTG
jgi:hypothetical protein